MTLTKEILQETSLVRIVDDDPALRRALTFFLKVEGWKSVSYDGPFSFLEGDDPKVPGCLVLDLKMPGATGTDLQHQLKVEENVLPVIFLSAHGDIDTAVYAVLEGAVDFLQKPVDEERLLRAVEKACRMHHERLRGGPGEDEARARWETLTEREMRVAKLVAEGLVTRVIAERFGVSVPDAGSSISGEMSQLFGVSPRTVDAHRANLLRKLGVRTPREVAEIVRLVSDSE